MIRELLAHCTQTVEAATMITIAITTYRISRRTTADTGPSVPTTRPPDRRQRGVRTKTLAPPTKARRRSSGSGEPSAVKPMWLNEAKFLLSAAITPYSSVTPASSDTNPYFGGRTSPSELDVDRLAGAQVLPPGERRADQQVPVVLGVRHRHLEDGAGLPPHHVQREQALAEGARENSEIRAHEAKSGLMCP